MYNKRPNVSFIGKHVLNETSGVRNDENVSYMRHFFSQQQTFIVSGMRELRLQYFRSAGFTVTLRPVRGLLLNINRIHNIIKRSRSRLRLRVNCLSITLSMLDGYSRIKS